MANVGEHAVVLGGSMAGLLAARVVAEAYERVTIVNSEARLRRPTRHWFGHPNREIGP